MKYRSDDLARLLYGSYIRMHRRLDAAMAERGASLSRTKLLLLVQKRSGEVRAADLADWLGQAPRTVTEALDGLERGGLIERVADAHDRRVKRLRITDAGKSAIAETEPLRLQLTSAVFGTLREEEREMLGDILTKLVDRLDGDCAP